MTAKDYRATAWQKVKPTLVPSVLAALIAWLLGGPLVSATLGFDLTWEGEVVFSIPSVQGWIIGFLGIGGLLSIVRFILGGPIRQGYGLFLLKQQDGEALDIKDLFSQLSSFGAGFCLFLLEGLYIALWTLLFIIPGFIAAYKYAMAPFIMLENPDMTASEAITASKDLMDGHKWELFCLDFSFIGWHLVSILTLGIGALVVNPYMNAARAAFYRNLCPKAEPQPTVEFLPETTEE